jgi:hypothetical protein
MNANANDAGRACEPGQPASTETIAAYRAMVARLLENCVGRVAAWPLPRDAEPLLQWKPRRD